MNIPFSLRHGLFFLTAALALVGGYLVLYFSGHVGVIVVILFLLALVANVLTALVSPEKWIGLLWFPLFLLLGLVSRHTTLLGMDLLFGGSFSLLFFRIRMYAENAVRFKFFDITQPALKIFLIVFFLALAGGIFAGIPSTQIAEKMKEGVANLQHVSFSEWRIFGVNTASSVQNLTDKVTAGILKYENSLGEIDIFAQIRKETIRLRIQHECAEDFSCAQRIATEMQQESFANINAENNPEISSALTLATQHILQEKLGDWGNHINLSAILALIFFLILWPFAGIFSWMLCGILFLFFQFGRWSGLLQPRERSVKQEFFV